ncbi:preprotein translocase subunit YajC [Anoxybacillus mongoliensis]|uniref:Preprotein translocase subunit YajC n=1 Tax=Anoxybacillus mongoliensis TaxID=452565 RepID=A0A7W8JII8_9BACL|nr:YuiB family protein [Anoxybacillus mongoliensis]MBB5356313.1 preprotein translocase subunit YajC [Anoxybacillus mongoliensis]MCX8002311.1 YuiB family protein [Anoxybacillus mongoliensis]
MEMSIPVLFISILLFFVLFFGIGFLLNMILRTTWTMALLSPFVLLLWIDQISVMDYVTNPSASFAHVKERIGSLASADLIILSSGIVGAIVSGVVIQTLRKKGYRMF